MTSVANDVIARLAVTSSQTVLSECECGSSGRHHETTRQMHLLNNVYGI